jgi:protein-tyrosine-phosphatase
MPSVVMLCTGNAARSVIAGHLVEASGEAVRVTTAGTHVVEYQPMSRRTRAAILSLGVEPGQHRSHQLTKEDAEAADLIVAMAAEHVRYVRRHHPDAASKTATIRYLVRNLAPGDEPLASRIEALSLELVPLEEQEEVADPAGKEEPEYIACAAQLSALVEQLLPVL